jgi:hypothetical protein
VEQSLEGEGQRRGRLEDSGLSCFRGMVRRFGATSRGHRHQEWCTAARGGKSLKGKNPKSGFGMKQSRQAWGGQAPRGWENPKALAMKRGKLHRTSRCLRWENAGGKETPREDASAPGPSLIGNTLGRPDFGVSQEESESSRELARLHQCGLASGGA